MYMVKLDYIVNIYSNTYHRAIKEKSADVNSNTYFEFKKENNEEDPKFEVGDHVMFYRSALLVTYLVSSCIFRHILQKRIAKHKSKRNYI